MMQVAAIYGFEFTRRFEAAGLTFVPITNEYTTAKKLARSLDARHLTGVVVAPQLGRQVRFLLEGVLSFIEHLDVQISEPVAEPAAIDAPSDYFEDVASGGRRSSGGGAVVGSDAFGHTRESRQEFIERAMAYLSDENRCQANKFSALFFKAVETYRQRQPFLEITYFLLISGLEAFARASLNDKTSKAAKPIAKVLQDYGFQIRQDNPKELARAVSTYLHIRNALFHEGEFAKTVTIKNGEVTLNCGEYLFHLSMLTSLLIMRVIGFDDGVTNWDCWMDRMLHTRRRASREVGTETSSDAGRTPPKVHAGSSEQDGEGAGQL